MNISQAMQEGKLIRFTSQLSRAKSLRESAQNTLETCKLIPLTQQTSQTIFRELYEALHQLIEAEAYTDGFKLITHDSCEIYLKEKLNKHQFASFFKTIRQRRNKLNYEGKHIPVEIVTEFQVKIYKYANELLSQHE